MDTASTIDLGNQIVQAATRRLAGYCIGELLQAPERATRRPGDRRSEVGFRSALNALAAHEAGDLHRFYGAGFTLLQCDRQAKTRYQRAPGGDALTRLIRVFAAEFPGEGVEQIVGHITTAAINKIYRELADFDGEQVTFERAGKLIEVTLPALRRRVQRVLANRQ